MKVTATQLRKLRACQEQVDLFVATFGESVEITEALCLEHAGNFDWDWAAYNLLPAPAWADYERAMASAEADYERAMASAFGKLAESL